jgi:hypothetical protein
MPRRSPLATDPITEILAGTAAVVLAGWIVVSRIYRIRNRAGD